MNKNYEQIIEAGYTLEVTTTKRGEGYMHLLRHGERVIRIHIMTNNRTGKVIMASLPNAQAGTRMDIAMNDLKEVALNRDRRDKRTAIQIYLDSEINKIFARVGCTEFWALSARAQMYKYANEYAITSDVSGNLPLESHLNRFHDFAYHYLAGQQSDHSWNTFAGIQETINTHLK
jgi:hypothetical protein